MELLLLPVFQLLYFVSHFLYSLAQNVVSTWHLLTTIWHSTFDKISKSGLYKSTSGAHTSDPRGTASDPEVPGSLPQLWVSSAWSAIRRFWRYVASGVGNLFKKDRGNASAADEMTSGAHSSDLRETPADWEVPGSLPQLCVLAVWSSVRQCISYLTANQRDFIRLLRSRWNGTPNKNSNTVYTKGLAKTPRHLGVVLGQPSPSVALVASLITQAASYGVKYVSVYDAFGEFLRRKDEVLQEVRKVPGGAYCFREREEGLEREIERGSEREFEKSENLPENDGNSLENATEDSTGKSESSEKFPDISGKSSPENSRSMFRKCEEMLAENSEKSPEKSENYGESQNSTENRKKSPEKSDKSPENSPENSEARPVVEIKFLGVQDGRQRLAAVAEKLARDHARSFHLWAEKSEHSENFLMSESLVPGLRKRFKNVGLESYENSNTQKTSREYSSEILGTISLGLSNSRVISDSLRELSKSGETSRNFTLDSPNASSLTHTLRETSDGLSLNPKARESSHPATPPEPREFSAIPTLATPTAIPDDPKFRETHHIPTLDHSKLTLDHSKHTLATPIPTLSIPDISHILTPDFPDPEVLISIGGKSTLGYPPWGLRATEIHFLGLSEAYLGLARVMEAYAGCEQRWGR